MRYIALMLITLFLSGCSGTSSRVSGYIEAAYVDFSSPVAGRLIYRPTYDGQTLLEGDLLFSLSDSPEKERLQAIDAKIEQSHWQEENLKKGLRSDELNRLQSGIDHAQADLEYHQQFLDRLNDLSKEKTVSLDQLDQATQAVRKSQALLDEAESKFKSGQLGGRSDLILAQKALTKSLVASRNELKWYLKQKKLNIAFNARVKEIYYRKGEWVPAFSPILTVEQVDERYAIFYLNQDQLSGLAMGDRVSVLCSGCGSVDAQIVSIADHAEFTPPIVYTTDQGELYRFQVKAQLSASRYLHPGQPVTIELPHG